MYQELNDRLAAAAAQVDRLEKLYRRLEQLDVALETTAEETERLGRKLSKEERDVAKLEGFSLSSLLASFTGTKDERLTKETQEAVTARAAYDDAARRLQTLEAEQELTQREIAELEPAEADYQQLLAEKERLMAQDPSPAARRLFALGEQEQEIARRIRELEEALEAGEQAHRDLTAVARSLDSAEGWGTWDMLGGGMMATAMKHSHIDAAQAKVHEARTALSRFHRELADVTERVDVPNVDLDDFSRVADYFFDGWFADWMIQDRINQSQQAVANCLSQVDQICSSLDGQLQTAQAELETAQEARRQFIQQFQA